MPDYLIALAVMCTIAAPAAWLADRVPEAWVDAVGRHLNRSLPTPSSADTTPRD
jgi:hypothetical protein